MELARALENAKKASDDKKYSSPLLQAYAYARAEDNDQAMKCLETTYAEHSPRLGVVADGTGCCWGCRETRGFWNW